MATLPGVTATPAGPGRRSTRDRRGRGLRGVGVPAGLPAARSRAQRFDDLALDAWDHVAHRWSAELADVDLAVEDVPPELTGDEENVLEDGAIPLARITQGDKPGQSVLVLFRRPLEARAAGTEELAELVHDVVVEEIAAILGRDPDEVDPPA